MGRIELLRAASVMTALGVVASCAAAAPWQTKGTLAFSLVSSHEGDRSQLSWSNDLDLWLTRPTGERQQVWIYLQNDYGKVRDRAQGVSVTAPDRVDWQAKHLWGLSPRYSGFVSYSLAGDHSFSDTDHALGLGVRVPLGRHLVLDVAEEILLGEGWQHKVQIYYARDLGRRLKATGTGSTAGETSFDSAADAGLTYQLSHELAVRLNALFTKRRGDANWARTLRFQAVWSIGPGK